MKTINGTQSMGPLPRLYHLVSVNHDKGDAKTYLTGYPMEHAQCCTMRSKLTEYPKRSIRLEEIAPHVVDGVAYVDHSAGHLRNLCTGCAFRAEDAACDVAPCYPQGSNTARHVIFKRFVPA